MRTAFIQTLCELAEQDERIWLLCGDLGYSVLESFANRFPERFVNVGVAEQNMAGIATGLALCDKIVFIYSIANFPTLRCLEQIRNDICYHNVNVKIVAVGGGLTYGSHGYTHHAVEDLAVMRILPNMAVLAPGDPIETRLATKAIAAWDGPCYMRIGKAGEPILYQSEPDFQIGKAITVSSGKDLTLIVTGGMLNLVVQALEKLKTQGYSVQVLSMPSISPLDELAIIQAAQNTTKIITVEEHGLGGLSSAVAEVLVTLEQPIRFIPLRLSKTAVAMAGSQDFIRAMQKISIDDIVEHSLNILSK